MEFGAISWETWRQLPYSSRCDIIPSQTVVFSPWLPATEVSVATWQPYTGPLYYLISTELIDEIPTFDYLQQGNMAENRTISSSTVKLLWGCMQKSPQSVPLAKFLDWYGWYLCFTVIFQWMTSICWQWTSQHYQISLFLLSWFGCASAA